MEDDDIDLAEENAPLRAELLAANAQQSAAHHLVNAIKIPPFWPTKPVECFFQVESVFSNNNINNEQICFNYVLQQLPQETRKHITTVLDIIQQQATLANPYTSIKQKLISTFGKTKYQMCDELFDMPALGSGRPSLLMSNMLALLPDGNQPGTWFLVLCLCRLPEWMCNRVE